MDMSKSWRFQDSINSMYEDYSPRSPYFLEKERTNPWMNQTSQWANHWIDQWQYRSSYWTVDYWRRRHRLFQKDDTFRFSSLMNFFPSLQEHLSANQKRPLYQRFKIMEEVLRSSSLKELKSSFPYIIHEIFDFEKELDQGWQLDKISRHHSPELFSSIRSLLSPEGALMKVVNCLHSDPTAMYEFPLKYLPAPSRHMIEGGAIPAFYGNKLQVHNLSSPVVMLNAFEYYMFHLAFALVNPLWRSVNHNWNDLHEYMYPALVEDMLTYFLPCDKSSLPSVPQFGGPTVRPIISQNQGRPFSKKVSQTNLVLSSSSHRSLFKSSFLNAQKLHMQNMPVYDQTETETWRSETFLQILVEFWLNQNSTGVHEMQSYSCGIPEHLMPTMNHVKMVRLLVKYVHYFANSAASVINSPYNHTVQSPLDQFKRSVIPHIVQKKLYIFLKHAFAMWPLDSCFGMVLETWLSYIQPWRYKDMSKGGSLASHQSDNDWNKFVDNQWESFVEDNLLFYTVLAAEFIPRIYRMDLASPYSAYMVFRVSKILNLPNLKNLIMKAESEFFGNMSHHTDLGGSYLSGHNLYLGSNLPSQWLDLEGPNFQYLSFFSDAMKHNMSKVVSQLTDALEFVRSQQFKDLHGNGSEKGGGFWASIFRSRSSSRSVYTPSEYKRLPGHLEQTIGNFCEVFNVIRPAGFAIPNSSTNINSSISDESMYLTDPDKCYPECVETELGLRLTDTGRRQLINRERKFDNFYVGDPDLQPVRSYENATLVGVLFHFCCFLNSYFRSEFISLYNAPTFTGHFSRVFLIPPSAPEDLQRKIHSPISKRAAHLTRSHQPRITLRFLASYHTLMRIAMAYFFLSFMLGTGPVLFLIIALSLVVTYGLLVAVYRTLRYSTWETPSPEEEIGEEEEDE